MNWLDKKSKSEMVPYFLDFFMLLIQPIIVTDMATNITFFGATLISLAEKDFFKLKVLSVVTTMILMQMLLVLFKNKNFWSKPKITHASCYVLHYNLDNILLYIFILLLLSFLQSNVLMQVSLCSFLFWCHSSSLKTRSSLV